MLRLDDDGQEYLRSLASADHVDSAPARRLERVPVATLEFLDALPMPAFIHDRRMTVLATNRLGSILSTNYQPGRNLLRAIFLDADEHDVHRRSGGVSLLEHPEVGRLELRHEKLLITGTDGQTLVAYHAESGSPSAEGLRLLGVLAATRACSET